MIVTILLLGMCEMVMIGEDIPRKLSNVTKFDCYPGVDESDDEDDEVDVMGQSFDIHSGKDFKMTLTLHANVILGDIKLKFGVLISDIDFGIHRQRSTTAQRLEKMDQDRKKTNRIKHIKWEWNPVVLTGMSVHLLLYEL